MLPASDCGGDKCQMFSGWIIVHQLNSGLLVVSCHFSLFQLKIEYYSAVLRAHVCLHFQCKMNLEKESFINVPVNSACHTLAWLNCKQKGKFVACCRS